MADIKVSQMGEVLVASNNDLLNLVSYDDQNQTYVSGKVKASTLKSYMVDDLEVSDLYDTTITTPTDDDGLVYNGTSQKWENVPITTKEQWKKNGAYNLLPNNGTTQVINGITFTFNSDGTVTVQGTLAPGQEYAIIRIYQDETHNLPSGTYRLCGCPTPNESHDFWLNAWDANVDLKEYGSGADFTITAGVRFYAAIVIHADIPNAITFKPMLTTDLNATYNDYVPHAKTNRELTEYATTKKGSLSASQYTTSAENVRVRQVGNSVHIWGFCNNNIQHSDGSNNNVLGTITGVTLPKTDEAVRTVCGIAAHAYDVPQQVGYLSLATNGELIFKTTQTGTKSVYFDISYAV